MKPRGRIELLVLREKMGPYTKEDFEWQRAYNESPMAPPKEMEEAVKRDLETGDGSSGMTLPQMKAAMVAVKPILMEEMNRNLLRAMKHLLKETTMEPTALLMRWKLRRLMEEMAKELDVELPWPGPEEENDQLARPPKTRKTKRAQLAL